MGFLPADNPVRSARRDWIELAAGYGLILLALWTPRPIQRYCDWAALAWVVAATVLSFEGWRALGLTHHGFLRSLWVPVVALVLAWIAILVSRSLGASHEPASMGDWVRRYGAYSIWALLQAFLVLDFFLLRLLRRVPSRVAAVVVTALLFTSAHIPNPVLMPLVLVWGLIACVVFLRYRNLYTLGMAHAILGIAIAVSVPGPVDHNMRVGLGYLTYHAPQHGRSYLNQSPQTVSTQAWVMAEAPTRRRERQARP